MIGMVTRRALQAIPLLLIVSMLVFGLLQLVPGGPLAAFLENPNVRPEDLERLKRALGLDRSVPEQYLAWLSGFVRGEWGFSYSDGRPVGVRLLERVPATLELLGAATVLALVLALGLGLLSSRSRLADRLIRTLVIAGTSVPVFWLGLVVQLLFAHALGILPSSGRQSPGDATLVDRLQHLVLPTLVLGTALAAGWTQYLRSAMRSTLSAPFLRAVSARGISNRAKLLRHALPVSLPPVIAAVMVDLAMLVSGAVVTETVFAWPGIGSLFTEALARRDYTVLMAFLMCGAVVVVLCNLVADMVVAWLDPRTRVQA
jgi:peptide/nickel transport system permease protein